MYYSRKGEPLEMLDWGRLMEDIDYKRVAYDELAPTTVCAASFLSTVWLGIDHSWGGGPPVIFETVRFTLDKQYNELLKRPTSESLEFPDPDDPSIRTEQLRYCTEEQALLGHRLIIRLIQEKEMQ
jgi:hypothetical protein